MIDLHTHSTYSDGSLSPKELVRLASRSGLRYLALTDHDCISGLAEAHQEAQRLNLGFIAGVEIEIKVPHGEFHLLGLNLLTGLDLLEEKLKELREKRNRRNQLICEKMQANGIKVSPASLAQYASGQVISRLHIAEFLVKNNLASSIAEAFELFLKPGRPFYCEKESLDFVEAKDLIKSCKGKAILAHPFSLKLEFQELTSYILDLKSKGLDGLEAYHSDYLYKDCQRLDEWARQNQLLVTAGSDFHGPNWPHRQLGFACSGWPIPDYFVRNLL